jgi:glycosyltransferase involved in cell wall biosynthesis
MADATFANVLDYYPDSQNLLGISKRHGLLLEKRAIQKSSFLIYPSEWAAQSAINDFRAERSSIGIVPFGANLDAPPSVEILRQKNPSEVCRLLFLAVEWRRKGGDLAFQTFLELKNRGIKTKLTVCGCSPPEGVSDPDLEVTGFLNKNVPSERERIERLLLNSDFMLMPTRADCTPIVFCEASAFGLPSVTTDTGGVKGAVRHGINGLLLPITAGAGEIANAIAEVFQNKASYDALARSARTEYETRLNWDAWGTTVSNLIRQHPFPQPKPL